MRRRREQFERFPEGALLGFGFGATGALGFGPGVGAGGAGGGGGLFVVFGHGCGGVVCCVVWMKVLGVSGEKLWNDARGEDFILVVSCFCVLVDEKRC